MGGPGSGRRWGSGRATTEGRLKLDVSWLARNGYLSGGVERRGALTWSRGDERVGAIGIAGRRDAIEVSGRWRSNAACDSREWREMRAGAQVEWTSCRFGGVRPFFVCPGCARCVLHLYIDGPALSCRHCQRLTYASRRERESDRLMRRANTLRRRLGGPPGAAHDIAPRPKHMRRTTYERIVEAIRELEAASLSHLAAFVLAMDRGLTTRSAGGDGRRTAFWGKRA